jgi:hypothetical protein
MLEQIIWLAMFMSMMGIVLLEHKSISVWRRKEFSPLLLFHTIKISLKALIRFLLKKLLNN